MPREIARSCVPVRRGIVPPSIALQNGREKSLRDIRRNLLLERFCGEGGAAVGEAGRLDRVAVDAEVVVREEFRVNVTVAGGKSGEAQLRRGEAAVSGGVGAVALARTG